MKIVFCLQCYKERNALIELVHMRDRAARMCLFCRGEMPYSPIEDSDTKLSPPVIPEHD